MAQARPSWCVIVGRAGRPAGRTSSQCVGAARRDILHGMTPSSLPPTVAAHVPTGVLIDGAWRPASTGRTFEVADPATTETLFDVADGGEQDALDALTAAHDAFPEWRATAPRVRAELLRAVFETLTARTEDIAALITAEGGKPLAESRAEVAYGADYVRWYSEQAVRFEGLARRAPSGTNHQLVLRRPVGPALLITPWNFPIAMIARKVAPALAAGCTVVIKPAQLTPLTTAYVAEIIREELEGRGLPTGVINVVPSASARTISGPLLADPRLRKLSFTGSTEVGAALLKASADNILRTSMELGGNAPFLVFEDADIPAAVQGAVQAKMRNAGQTCVAANRFLVHASVAEEFTAGLTAAFDAARRRARRRRGHDGRAADRGGGRRPRRGGRRGGRRRRRARAHRRRPARPARLLLRADRARPRRPPTCGSSPRRRSARSRPW